MANSFSITINVSTDLGGSGQLRVDSTGGATAGGGFTLADGLTLTANIYGGSVAGGCVTCNPTTQQFIVGNVFGGTGGSFSASGITNTSGVGTLYVTGNISGGSGSSNGTTGINLGSCSLQISGNVTGSSNASFAQGEGIRMSSGNSCTITGIVTGGSNAASYGVRVTGTGSIIANQAIGGVAAPAINNESTGQVTVTRAVGNGFGGGSVGLSAAVGVSNVVSQSSITIVEQIEFGTLGQSPVNGRIRLKKMGTNGAVFNFCDTAGAKTLIDATANAAMPAAADVRSGVSYASGAQTGSCAVPAASSVAFGVSVDNTTGTALLTGAAVATAVWSAASRTITEGGITAADVWSAATRTITGGTVTTLTNAPTVPTAAAIATQVRSELATELARVDAAVSTRLASSVSTNITAIKAKTDLLNTDRLAQCATTSIVGSLIAQSNS
jgi:hypothetical protein